MAVTEQICASNWDPGGHSARLTKLHNSGTPIAERLQTLVADLPAVCVSNEQKAQVARLRYRSYRAAGAVGANAHEAIWEDCDGDANVAIFAFLLGKDPVATIRVHVVRGTGTSSPACRVFPDIVADWISEGRSIIDPSCFCVDPLLARRLPLLALLALRIPVLLAQAFAPSWLIATPRRGHEAFYRRNFGGLRLAEPRPYPGRVHPLALMGNRMEVVAEAIFRRYPVFRGEAGELARLRALYAGAAL